MTESVWNYPRPPLIRSDPRRVVVKHGDRIIADSTNTLCVLETSHPPVFYIPLNDVDRSCLQESPKRTHCEFKGSAHYLDLVCDPPSRAVAWGYARPEPGYEALVDHLAFYPDEFTCTVDGVAVEPQPGGFYGGWITPDVTGPFKGAPGTAGW